MFKKNLLLSCIITPVFSNPILKILNDLHASNVKFTIPKIIILDDETEEEIEIAELFQLEHRGRGLACDPTVKAILRKQGRTPQRKVQLALAYFKKEKAQVETNFGNQIKEVAARREEAMGKIAIKQAHVDMYAGKSPLKQAVLAALAAPGQELSRWDDSDDSSSDEAPEEDSE